MKLRVFGNIDERDGLELVEPPKEGTTCVHCLGPFDDTSVGIYLRQNAVIHRECFFARAFNKLPMH